MQFKWKLRFENLDYKRAIKLYYFHGHVRSEIAKIRSQHAIIITYIFITYNKFSVYSYQFTPWTM